MATQEISIELVYEHRGDGRYSITSDDVPGFRMVGSNLDALQADLNEVVSDLLLLNCGFAVTNLRWVPSPEDVKKHLEKPSPVGRAVYIASGSVAA